MLQSFVSPCIMALEILVAQLVFGRLLTKKDFFITRILGSWFICLLAVVCIALVYYGITGEFFSYSSVKDPYESVYKFFYYIAIFAITVGCGHMCYSNSIWIILFYSAGAYALQHMVMNMAAFFTLVDAVSGSLLIMQLIEFAFCAIMYSGAYFLLVWKKDIPQTSRGMKLKVLLTIVVIFICIGISRFANDDASRGDSAFIAETLYAIVSCGLVLGVLFSMTKNDKIQNEMEITKQLLHREKEQYQLSKENIDIINIKCHDLKHQLSLIQDNMQSQNLAEIESSVRIYESIIETGNNVLDVLLTEKSLYCESNNITITCLVDGKKLDFMDDMDIYSLFGNALTNAIESVKGIEEKQRRCIIVKLKKVNKFISIHFENFYEGNVVLENGLPVTSKDKNFHGFGMKSMRYIADKYNGNMTLIAKNGTFKLDFLFPLAIKSKS